MLTYYKLHSLGMYTFVYTLLQQYNIQKSLLKLKRVPKIQFILLPIGIVQSTLLNSINRRSFTYVSRNIKFK